MDVGCPRDEPVRLLLLSDLIPSRGYYDVLEAVTILRKMTARRLEAIFAGYFLSSTADPVPTSPEKAEARFHEHVAENDLQDIVCYVEPGVGKVQCRLLETGDFPLLLTKYFTEGQPAAIIAAMAYGCVVISTDY